MAIVVSDSFTGADNASLDASWSILEGGFKIKSNRAESTVGQNYNTAVREAGASDVSTSVTLWANGSGNFMRVVTRATDANNYIFANIKNDGTGQVFKKVAGSFTQIATLNLASLSLTYADGSTFKITANGSSIKVFYNATEIASITETFNQTATKHGISMQFTGPQVDDFTVDTLSGGTTVSGSAALTAVGTISASGTMTMTGAATLQGVGTLAANGQTTSTGLTGSASLQGAATLTSSGIMSIQGAATLQGASTLTVLAGALMTGSATLTGVGTLTAIGTDGTPIYATIRLTGQIQLISLAGDIESVSLQGSTNPPSVALEGEL